uniref:RNA-directed DNA polymerase n=1 Tax=Strongyloides papillosus TaxID=174720 RepID=A0A0N5C4U4_STREA
MVVTRTGPPTTQKDGQIIDNHVQPTNTDDMHQIVRLLTEQKETMSTLMTSISNIESRLQQVEIKQNQIREYPTTPEGGRTLNDPAAEDHKNGRNKNKNKKNNRQPIKSPKINQEDDDNDGNYHNISQLSSQIEALSINSSTGNKRPPNISLEKFNGKISFQIWLKKFMAYCKINSIDSDMKHEVLLLMLEDEPASDANRIELYDFHTLSSFLCNKYKGQYSIASAFHELEIITSRPVRKPEELDATCKKISDIIEILEESKPTDYILQRKIEALSKVLPLELRSKILLTASIFPSFDVAISSTKRAWALDYRADIERSKGNTLSKNKKKKKYCSNCNTNTHNTDMCRLKDKNKHRKEKINKVDDEESSMDSSSSSSSSEDEESVYKISESIEKNLESISNKGLIGTHVTVNGHSCVAMVDPGSTCTIIDKEFARKIKIPIRSENGKQVEVLSNTATVYKIKDTITINVLGYDIKLNSRIYISNTNFYNSSYQVILGNNILKKVDGKINTKKDHDEINFVFEKANGDNKLEEKLRQQLQIDFKDVIAQHDFDVGKGQVQTPLQEYYEEREPLKIRYYPVPLNDRVELDKITDMYLKHDIIEKCDSTHIAPVMILNKPSEDPSIQRKRFVLDVRESNSVTKYVNYEPPTLQMILNSIRKYQFASSIDLCSGFLQLSIPEEIRDRYAFKTSKGIFRFKRLVQGARNSPGIFQRTMESIFAPLKDNMLIYQDDLLVISDGNEAQHKELLYQFFSIARQHGLKINFNKSKFFKKIVSFLGWDISPTGVTPSLKSVESIMKLKLPVDKKQLYQRLQKFSYHRLAIKDYAKLSSKLYEMTSGRNCKIELTGENLKNYLTIVETLYKQPLLYHANPSKPYILTCDASATAVGATLSQLDDSQIERPISFFSCKLPHVKKPRSATYNELYAIKRALQFNKYLLTGAHIKIRSDHRPLEKLVQNTQEKRFYDLVECINSYNCSIEYIEGVKNSSADCLSRLPHSDVSSESDAEKEEVNILLRKKTKKNYNEVKVMRNIFKPTSTDTLKDENKINDDKKISSLKNNLNDDKTISSLKNNVISLEKRGPGRPRKKVMKDDAKQSINDALKDNEDINTPQIANEHSFLSNKDHSSCINNTTLFHTILPNNFNIRDKQQLDLEIIAAMKSKIYDNKPIQVINGIVHVQVPSKEGGNDLLPIIPSDPETCQLVFNICHTQSGHFGLEKSLEFLKTYGYLKKSRKIFEQFYKECVTCAEVNSPLQKHCEMKTVQYSRPLSEIVQYAKKALVNPKYILEQSHFKEGDKVYAKLPDFSRGRKLAKKWKGPYTIEKMEDAVAFITLDNLPKKKIRKLHIDKLKKFRSNKEE